MTIFTATGVNVSVSPKGESQERLVVDRGTLRLYASGIMQVIDRENQLICSISLQSLSHMTKKIVRNQEGTIEKGRTRLFFKDNIPVTVGRFSSSLVVLRMETADHRTFNDICKRSGVPYH